MATATDTATNGDARWYELRRNPLVRISQLWLGGALDDVRSMAQTLRELPRIAEYLASIRDLTESLNAEVTRMRQGVDAIRHEIAQMQAAVDPLDERMREVREGFARIEPHLTDIVHTMRPIRRARARLGNRPPVENGEQAD